MSAETADSSERIWGFSERAGNATGAGDLDRCGSPLRGQADATRENTLI